MLQEALTIRMFQDQICADFGSFLPVEAKVIFRLIILWTVYTEKP